MTENATRTYPSEYRTHLAISAARSLEALSETVGAMETWLTLVAEKNWEELDAGQLATLGRRLDMANSRAKQGKEFLIEGFTVAIGGKVE